MIRNWQKVLLTFLVGAFVYLFSSATTDYSQIRSTIVSKADANSQQVGYDQNLIGLFLAKPVEAIRLAIATRVVSPWAAKLATEIPLPI